MMIRKKFTKTKCLQENLLSSERELIKNSQGTVIETPTSFKSENPESEKLVKPIGSFCLDTAVTSDDFSPNIGLKKCEETIKPFPNWIQGMNKIDRNSGTVNEPYQKCEKEDEGDSWSIENSPPLYADYKIKLHNILLSSSFSSWECEESNSN